MKHDGRKVERRAVGSGFATIFPKRRGRKSGEGALRRRLGGSSRRHCGFCTRGRSGAFFRSAIRTTRRCIGGFRPGSGSACSSECWKIWREAKQRGLFDGTEAYVDASFARAKGGGAGVGKTKAGKRVKIMAIVDRCELPLSSNTHPANPHEATLVQLSLDLAFVEDAPANLIGQGVRQRSVGRRIAGAGRRDGRAAPAQSNAAANAGRSSSSAGEAEVDRGAVLRLDAVEAPASGPLGASSGELSGVRSDVRDLPVLQAPRFLR